MIDFSEKIKSLMIEDLKKENMPEDYFFSMPDNSIKNIHLIDIQSKKFEERTTQESQLFPVILECSDKKYAIFRS